HLFIESDTAIEKVELYDVSGRRVLQLFSNKLKMEVKTETLQNGLYLALITSEGKTISQKIIKK
ncbi:MAG TPA: hypothetical protein DEG69_16415, partial [Flavobacteriaceae bacterium]|nr:hypothetical protein [Flavobacteriaceae bacterium]